MDLFKEFSYEAAHRLPSVPPEHKCAPLHGHSFRVEARVRGHLHPQLGCVIDLGDIKQTVQALIDKLDHRYVNENDGLANPTSEILALWLWRHLSAKLPILPEHVRSRETCLSGCTFCGPELESK
jgi:6-pyruvoyltetrahydropterin/6-carboxytetrahydropterin synthase